MFDLSFSEIGLVGVIALMLLGPKEMIVFIKSIRDFFASIRQYYKSYLNYLNKAINEVEEETKLVDVILDQDGNYQKVYDLSKVMPQIKDPKASNE